MLGAYYATKKDLKAAKGKPLRYQETSMFGTEYTPNGVVYVVGPDAYNNRKWYARVTIKNGIIIAVS